MNTKDNYIIEYHRIISCFLFRDHIPPLSMVKKVLGSWYLYLHDLEQNFWLRSLCAEFQALSELCDRLDDVLKDWVVVRQHGIMGKTVTRLSPSELTFQELRAAPLSLRALLHFPSP